MSSCESLFDCSGNLFCCNSICVSFDACNDVTDDHLSFGAIMGIVFGSFFVISVTLGCLTYYCFWKAQMRTSMNRAGVITTTTAGPMQNNGVTNYQSNWQNYPTSAVPSGQTTVYPQGIITSQPPAAPVTQQYPYQIPQTTNPDAFPRIEPSAPNDLNPTAPPPYESLSTENDAAALIK